MKEYTLKLVGYKVCTATIVVEADSQDLAIDKTVGMLDSNTVVWAVSDVIQDVEVDSIDPFDDEEDEEDLSWQDDDDEDMGEEEGEAPTSE
jgi:hypothetical protein